VKYVVGMCPGCDNWQIEAPTDTPLEIVEEILKDHSDACPWLEALATVQREQNENA